MMVENQHGGMRLKEGEDRRLFPVLQQTSKPYQEHHPQGDLWLQSMWKEGGHLSFAESVVGGTCNCTYEPSGVKTP